MSDPQAALLDAHLGQRGFRVARHGTTSTATKGPSKITVDGGLGLASSSLDLLDAIGPAVPALLEACEGPGRDVGQRYYSIKRSSGLAQVQLFPRLESSRAWASLRRDGLCGLTPDEALAIKKLLMCETRPSSIECVTESPREGSEPLQMGRKLYYTSRIPKAEFLSSLRVMGDDPVAPVSYLPKDAILRFSSIGSVGPLMNGELGEWCCA